MFFNFFVIVIFLSHVMLLQTNPLCNVYFLQHLVMDSGYVNYLNRPKRAKYNVDSDVVLQQIFQASIWNSCLSFQQSTEVKALSRKYISCPDKTNLRDEVKFDLKHTATTCSCIYRHQQCQKHASTSYSSCASNEAYNDYVANCHNLKADHLASRKRRHSLYNKVLGQKFKLRHHCRHYPYGQTNRGDNNFLNCSNRIGMHESSSSPNVFNSITLKGSASTNHVVEAEALCMCQSVPKPLVSCFYEKDSLSFFIRKSLALYLVLNFSLKTNRRDIDGKISISSKLKKLIKILCKITYAKPVSCKSCFNHINHISKSFEKNNFSYLYYDKNGIVTSLEKYLKHSFPLDDSLLSSPLQASQVLGNEKEVNGEQHDEDCTSNDTSLMINTLLSNYCSHSVCDSHCSYQKKFPSLLNANMSSSNKRISSRLQKKRDSGVRGPYSADYIVEVPVIKAKKPKSSHPYSHPLFWNFYNNLEKSESCRWRTLAMTYFKTSKPHIQNNHLNISDDFNFLDLPENQKFSKRPGNYFFVHSYSNKQIFDVLWLNFEDLKVLDLFICDIILYYMKFFGGHLK